MNKFIGVKLIEAEPMTRGDYNLFRGWTIPGDENPNDEGYLVRYSDSYVSWSPKSVFERAYLEVTPNPRLKTNCSISQKMVNEFIKEVHTTTLGGKTTVVRAILVNGFELVESSACVDPENYSEEIGAEICLERIKDKIWFLLGFLLQCGVGGIR
jgi:hypothetical protein